MNWRPSPGVIAQAAHIGWGGFLVLAIAHFKVPPNVAAVIVLGFVLLKELWFDIKVEKATFTESGVDLIFWMAGIVLGVMIATLGAGVGVGVGR